MYGSNLPPGVTESMIPGNRPEDLAEEEFVDWMLDRFYEEKFDIDDMYDVIEIGIREFNIKRNLDKYTTNGTFCK